MSSLMDKYKKLSRKMETAKAEKKVAERRKVEIEDKLKDLGVKDLSDIDGLIEKLSKQNTKRHKKITKEIEALENEFANI